ncbi:MAG: DNA glycosylase AlkZ-like family protein [Promethearchaeota archaeon]
MEIVELNQVNKFILDKHHLLEDSKTDDIIKIARDLCGLHSTELKTSYLSLLARTHNFQKNKLAKELYTKKTLARIRGMRRTLFIVPLEMVPILYSATYNMVEKSFEKFMEFYKVSLKQYQEISQNILTILKGNELSTAEIRKELDSKLNIPAIIQVMCNRKLLIRGKPIKDWKDRRNKYALFKEYFPMTKLDSYSEEKAIELLVEKYVKAYGPVTETDISWWVGLTKNQIRKGLEKIESHLANVKISGIKKNYLIFHEDLNKMSNNKFNEKPLLTLLPLLDPYPMGYKDRERYIDSQNYHYIFDRSGNITSTIFMDGRAIGVWDTEEKPEKVLKIYLFHSISQDLLNEIHSKAEKLGKFYFDEIVPIQECKSMTPLTERNAGGFMSPLKNC